MSSFEHLRGSIEAETAKRADDTKRKEAEEARQAKHRSDCLELGSTCKQIVSALVSEGHNPDVIVFFKQVLQPQRQEMKRGALRSKFVTIPEVSQLMKCPGWYLAPKRVRIFPESARDETSYERLRQTVLVGDGRILQFNADLSGERPSSFTTEERSLIDFSDLDSFVDGGIYGDSARLLGNYRSGNPFAEQVKSDLAQFILDKDLA